MLSKIFSVPVTLKQWILAGLMSYTCYKLSFSYFHHHANEQSSGSDPKNRKHNQKVWEALQLNTDNLRIIKDVNVVPLRVKELDVSVYKVNKTVNEMNMKLLYLMWQQRQKYNITLNTLEKITCWYSVQSAELHFHYTWWLQLYSLVTRVSLPG